MKKLTQNYLQTFYDEAGQPSLTSIAYGNDLERWLRFLRQHLGREPEPADLNEENVRAFLAAEAAAGVATTTLRRRVSVLRGLHRFAAQNGIVLPPLERPSSLLAPYLQVQPQTVHAHLLTAEDLDKLRRAIALTRPPLARRDWATLCLILETGLPVRRVIALNLADVDWEQAQVRMPVFQEPLWLPLHDAAAALRDYVENGRPDLLRDPTETSLFISQGGQRLSRQSLWQTFRNWGEHAGLPYRLTPRLLRDTAALRMLQRGLSRQTVGRLLGYTNPLSMQALIRRLRPHWERLDLLYPLGGIRLS